MTKALKTMLERAREWPKADQDELAAYAREIEERKSGVYILSEDERVALTKAKKSKLVPEKKMKEFWKKLGVA